MLITPKLRNNMGEPAARIGACLKVTGEAKYADDFALVNPAYTVLVTSAIARGSIEAIGLDEGLAVDGVLEIFTHLNCAGKLRKLELFSEGGLAATTILALESARIWHDGQIVAMVVAETFEAAREAAFKVKVSYHTEQAMPVFDAPGVETCAVAGIKSSHADPAVGDAAASLSVADVCIDAEYETPAQHHNPIELFATSCAWDGLKLTIYEPSQTVGGLQHGVARQLGRC